MIHILLRQSGSRPSATRPPWYDAEAAFQNLLATMDEACTLTVLFDGDPHSHFVKKYCVDVIRFTGGSDAASFGKLLVFAYQQRDVWKSSDIVYILEDDYVHRSGWPQIMREAFEDDQGDLVSLYDHLDRYKPGAGACRLSYTTSCHWRTAPSTTNTFALRFKTLLEDIPDHAKFVEIGIQQGHHPDQEKFVHLFRQKKRVLITSVPGYATHCEQAYLSPAADWRQILLITSSFQNVP